MLKECKTKYTKTKCNRCKGRNKKKGEDHVEVEKARCEDLNVTGGGG